MKKASFALQNLEAVYPCFLNVDLWKITYGEVKELTAAIQEAGETPLQFFVIYSKHSLKEGHFGVTLVIMNPANPNLPVHVLVSDTLLKDLPHHPRWWNHFITEFTQVFGDAIVEDMDDLSHPLQKVNVKGDDPYRHDWNCPYYAASMANALADLVKGNQELLINGSIQQIHHSMKAFMTGYYHQKLVKDRQDIQLANRLKRWKSGREVIRNLAIRINEMAD